MYTEKTCKKQEEAERRGGNMSDMQRMILEITE